MSKGRFIGPVFNEFREALNKNDLKLARHLKQEVATIFRKNPRLPPFQRAADMLYDSKLGKESEAITEARYLAKLPDLYAEISQSVIDTFENFNYPEDLIEYLNDIHSRFKTDTNTIVRLFTHLILDGRFKNAQLMAMELYRNKKSSQNSLYAAAAAFLRARSTDDEIQTFQRNNMNPSEIENLEKQRKLYYNFAVELVNQSEDKCLDGLQIVVESYISLEQYDEAIKVLNENKDEAFSSNMLTFYRLLIKCLELKGNSEAQIVELSLKVLEEINLDSIDEWRLIVQYQTDPSQIIEKYIEKYRGAFLAKIEFELKQIMNKNEIVLHQDQFCKLVLDYSNKYANKPFVFDDLLPYIRGVPQREKNNASKPVLSTISILKEYSKSSLFTSAITPELRTKLVELLKESKDFTIRSFANGTFSPTPEDIQSIGSENSNIKLLPVFIENQIDQYYKTKDTNCLYQSFSYLFESNKKKEGEAKAPSNKVNDNLDFKFDRCELSKETAALLLRESGILGLTRLQRDLFFSTLRADSVQLLSLAPLVVPDFINNWDLLVLSEYQKRVNCFNRQTLTIIMANLNPLIGFNRKNFFATFEMIQLKRDFEMNEVNYLFLLLNFLLQGSIQIDVEADVQKLYVDENAKSDIPPVEPSFFELNSFNFKKVAPCFKEVVGRYYGKYDNSIFYLYFNNANELNEALYPSESRNNLSQLVFELNAIVNLIFVTKLEREKDAKNYMKSDQVNDIYKFFESNLVNDNWKIVIEFAKSGSLDLYDSLKNSQGFNLSFIQVISLAAISKVLRKEMKNKIIQIVEDEGNKFIENIKAKLNEKVEIKNPQDFIKNELVVKWKDTSGKVLFENQINAVNYSINIIKSSLNK